MTAAVPSIRVRAASEAAIRESGAYVLYWMIAARRTRHNFALEHAVNRANEHGVGLVILEALRCGYPWASDRIHAFVIDGMVDNAADLADRPVTYYPYLEPEAGAGKGLLSALAERAVCVVTDEFPAFFLPKMVAAAARSLPVALEVVDGNGIYPLAATDRVFTTAASFRRHLQKEIGPHLFEMPHADPIASLVADGAPVIARPIAARWPPASVAGREQARAILPSLPIDHAIAPVASPGGARAAAEKLASFLAAGIERYGERNHPDAEAASGFSPYLHFGFLSVHQVFVDIMAAEDWDPSRIADKATGSRNGWWGASPALESFLDELITWREIGFNMCAKRTDYAAFDSLPSWARETLAKHSSDERETLYSLEELACAETGDPVWNAAQRQLREEGIITNYLRMLWGKRVLEWTPTPRKALEVLIELNNRYAIDGRDPNSYSGIFWVFGRYDRAWGPERPIFGKVRTMTSASTRRKLRIARYLDRFAPPAARQK